MFLITYILFFSFLFIDLSLVDAKPRKLKYAESFLGQMLNELIGENEEQESSPKASKYDLVGGLNFAENSEIYELPQVSILFYYFFIISTCTNIFQKYI